MEKEKREGKIKKNLILLINKIKEIFKNKTNGTNNRLLFIFAIFFSLTSLCFKNISIFIVLNVILFLSYNSKDLELDYNSKHHNLLLYLYIVVPSFSYIYLIVNKYSNDLLLWIFLLILFLKITIHLYKSIFDEFNFADKSFKKLLLTYIISVCVSIVIGIVSALLLKQKFLSFVLVNILLSNAVFFQEILNNKINSILETYNINNYVLSLTKIYNNFILVIPMVVLLTKLNLIK